MVHILGINLPDNQLARFALTSIYGVGPHLSHRLCARFQIHDRCRVKNLTPFQTTALASFLSSPQTAVSLPKQPLAPVKFVPKPPNKPISEIQAELAAARAAQKVKKEEKIENLRKLGRLPVYYTAAAAAAAARAADKGNMKPKVGRKLEEGAKSRDPLMQLRIESELRREIRENIGRHRMIGSYVGRRHSMSLPVRGQNTRSNAKTAKKLNRLERW
ncbi:hypothetical protein D9757_003692 [Collybiopsis confluens]|uniref:Ribosomal protein S13 n=1 Tax=Collybiopsis confluens TaxID=2823264 RepID=A0A8H5HUI3_9AGAR|nr:hypothetical protein D9757_003692 [Collybiopsis confluens]